MKKNYSITLRGKVQGVFFRATAEKNATAMGVTGFIKNMMDGSVYIEAEGEEDKLTEFINWCKIGPPAARVDRFEMNEGRLKGYEEFGIQR